MFDFSSYRLEFFSFDYESYDWPRSNINWRISFLKAESMRTPPRSFFMLGYNENEWELDLFFFPIL